ncbi:hypothetical protein P152DRAFT_246757 [Eremomyces bilateralis CBS 781.70]|uniref:Cell wall proline rich protein n=1 Tax=Eremomyces bilateralis CBS 781.70 TaxID=1392243 RepID=A0A6G1GBA2_9PEZI|nr:uncharacterized protein P152DRAFT_246757 [Eremomyces bilateralis CBS 781.70]KAF1815129.1 hypothetical protein P152DRAFT_246757 [Eremomyces bilateralis CBS 781.70]
MAMPFSLDASFSHEPNTMGSTMHSQRSPINDAHVELLPNPDFVFPALPSDGSTTRSTKRPLSTQILPTSKRVPRAAISERRSVNALPNFSFNPAGLGSAPGSSTSTPPHSPPLPSPSTPSRPMGHRRGGSELVGGDARYGTVSVVSNSPPKGDGFALAGSAPTRLGPPPGRRGHAHRRSGAISGHDLQSILQPRELNPLPNPLPTGGSAPVTPLETDIKPFFPIPSRRSVSQSSVNLPADPSVEPGPESSPRRLLSHRARVGFSEKVEYIRPLSTISSETESSLSTIRGHSVTGSLSSVVSGGASSPSPARSGRPSLHTTFEDESPRARPGTAGDILDLFTGGQDKVSGTISRPNSSYSPSPSKPTREFPTVTGSPPPKKRAFFGWEHRRSPTPVSPSLHPSASDPSLASSPEPFQSTAGEETVAADTKDATGKARKPRKVKSWANSLIRKPKSQQTKSRTQTQPQDSESSADDDMDTIPDLSTSFLLENFDVDDTVTIVAADDLRTPRINPETSSLASTPKLGPVHDSDTMSPVIDLDAALGPFNTPSVGNSGRNCRSARRSMHSGALPNNSFQNNHRRTESAPELVPFEARSGVAPVSTMADVFEEDEEEEEDSPKRNGMRGAKNVPKLSLTGASKDEGKMLQYDVPPANPSDDLSGFDFGEINQPSTQSPGDAFTADPPVAGPVGDDLPVSSDVMVTEPLAPSYHFPSYHRDPSPVEVVEPHEEPRASSLTRDSDSTITPPLHPTSDSPLQLPIKSPSPAPHSFTLGLPATAPSPHAFSLGLPPPPPLPPLMTPDSSTSSAFSSPAFSASQSSFETPRLGTATSSVTDGRGTHEAGDFAEAQSMREMMMLLPDGSEVPIRVSVDDVPSLTSSRSTATNGPPTSGVTAPGPPNHLQFFNPTYAVPQSSSGTPVSRAPLARPTSAFTLPYLRDARSASVCSIGLSARSSLALNATDESTPQAQGHMAHHDNPSDTDLHNRRRKRASIVSLSRLMGVGGALGEKSKLSVEQRAGEGDGHGHSRDMGEKAGVSMDSDARREKRGSRLSRMMKFWKSKEGLRS